MANGVTFGWRRFSFSLAIRTRASIGGYANGLARDLVRRHNPARMKITSRWLSFLLFSLVIGLALPLMAQTNDPTDTGGTSTGGSAFANLQYIIPLIAPILVMLLKKVPGWFETKFSKNLLPYLCVAVAFGLMLLLDLLGKLTIPIWIAGPVAGAIGIGSRELLDKGLGLLGIGGAATPAGTASKP